MKPEPETMQTFIRTTGELVSAGMNQFCKAKPEAAAHVVDLINSGKADLKVVINLTGLTVEIQMQEHGQTPVMIAQLEHAELMH